MADDDYSQYMPSYDYFGPLMDGPMPSFPQNKLVEPETRMQPDMLQSAMGLQPEVGTYVDELGRVYSKETNKLLTESRRPNVIPLTRNPNNELEFAMPRALDIVGNVMGGVVAPVKTADGAMIMGAGPIKQKPGVKLTPVEHNPFAESDLIKNMQSVRGDKALETKTYPMAPKDNWYGDANYETTGGKIVTMSPDEFLAKARPMQIDDAARENIDDLKKHIQSGNELDPLAIYKNGKEDGRHRAIAAKELGIDRVPVLSWDDTNSATLSAKVPVGMVAAGIRDAYQRTLSPLGLYSHGAEAAMSLPQAKGSPQQFKAMLEKAGVRPVEFENAGFDDAFAGKTSVTKDDVAKLFADKMPALEEKVLGNNKANRYTQDDENLIAELEGRQPNTIPVDRASDYNQTPTKFQQYTLPGSENYREVLLKAPVTQYNSINILQEFKDILPNINTVDDVNAAMKHNPQFRETVKGQTPEQILKNVELARASPEYQPPYKSSHWDDPNVVAHVRMADRNVNGEKTLHIEELQSDWAQEGRKKGFKSDKPLSPEAQELKTLNEKSWNGGLSDEEKIRLNELKEGGFNKEILSKSAGLPSGPYVQNTQQWTDLALKRALKEAADGDYDRMVWTPGAEQAKRYSLANQVDELRYSRNDDGTFNVVPFKNDKPLHNIEKENIPDKDLESMFGKEVAEKMRAYEGEVSGNVRSLSGQNLEVGGEGMKSYYDKIVPTRLKEIVKRIDPEAKIEMVPIENNTIKLFWKDFIKWIDEQNIKASTSELREMWANGATNPTVQKFLKENNGLVENKLMVPSIKMTPKLKEAIKKGLPAFSVGGAAALGVANSPNMRYNLKPVDHNPFEQKM